MNLKLVKKQFIFIRSFLKHKKESGYVSVLFCCISILLIGGLYYNVYIASSVKNLIMLQNSSDLSAYSLGIKASKGLNYISVNNVAIASSLHIGASVPILASYLTLIKAATEGSARIGIDQARALYGNGGFQKIWDRLKPIASTYLKIAAGATLFNQSIYKSWLGYSKFKAEEVFKMNYKVEGSNISFAKYQLSPDDKMNIKSMYSRQAPVDDSLIGIVKNTLDTGITIRDKVISYVDFGYEGITKRTSEDSLCKALRASKRAMESERDAPFYWMSGALPDNKLSEAIALFNKHVGKIQKYVPYTIGFFACGVNQKTFDSSFGRVSAEDKQFKYFIDNNQVKDIGFLVVTDTKSFTNSTSFRAIARSKLSKLSLVERVTQRTLKATTYVRVLNNEVKNKFSLFYPNWYPILIDELTI